MVYLIESLKPISLRILLLLKSQHRYLPLPGTVIPCRLKSPINFHKFTSCHTSKQSPTNNFMQNPPFNVTSKALPDYMVTRICDKHYKETNIIQRFFLRPDSDFHMRGVRSATWGKVLLASIAAAWGAMFSCANCLTLSLNCLTHHSYRTTTTSESRAHIIIIIIITKKERKPKTKQTPVLDNSRFHIHLRKWMHNWHEFLSNDKLTCSAVSSRRRLRPAPAPSSMIAADDDICLVQGCCLQANSAT